MLKFLRALTFSFLILHIVVGSLISSMAFSCIKLTPIKSVLNHRPLQSCRPAYFYFSSIWMAISWHLQHVKNWTFLFFWPKLKPLFSFPSLVNGITIDQLLEPTWVLLKFFFLSCHMLCINLLPRFLQCFLISLTISGLMLSPIHFPPFNHSNLLNLRIRSCYYSLITSFSF